MTEVFETISALVFIFFEFEWLTVGLFIFLLASAYILVAMRMTMKELNDLTDIKDTNFFLRSALRLYLPLISGFLGLILLFVGVIAWNSVSIK